MPAHLQQTASRAAGASLQAALQALDALGAPSVHPEISLDSRLWRLQAHHIMAPDHPSVTQAISHLRHALHVALLPLNHAFNLARVRAFGLSLNCGESLDEGATAPRGPEGPGGTGVLGAPAATAAAGRHLHLPAPFSDIDQLCRVLDSTLDTLPEPEQEALLDVFTEPLDQQGQVPAYALLDIDHRSNYLVTLLRKIAHDRRAFTDSPEPACSQGSACAPATGPERASARLASVMRSKVPDLLPAVRTLLLQAAALCDDDNTSRARKQRKQAAEQWAIRWMTDPDSAADLPALQQALSAFPACLSEFQQEAPEHGPFCQRLQSLISTLSDALNRHQRLAQQTSLDSHTELMSIIHTWPAALRQAVLSPLPDITALRCLFEALPAAERQQVVGSVCVSAQGGKRLEAVKQTLLALRNSPHTHLQQWHNRFDAFLTIVQHDKSASTAPASTAPAGTATPKAEIQHFEVLEKTIDQLLISYANASDRLRTHLKTKGSKSKASLAHLAKTAAMRAVIESLDGQSMSDLAQAIEYRHLDLTLTQGKAPYQHRDTAAEQSLQLALSMIHVVSQDVQPHQESTPDIRTLIQPGRDFIRRVSSLRYGAETHLSEDACVFYLLMCTDTLGLTLGRPATPEATDAMFHNGLSNLYTFDLKLETLPVIDHQMAGLFYLTMHELAQPWTQAGQASQPFSTCHAALLSEIDERLMQQFDPFFSTQLEAAVESQRSAATAQSACLKQRLLDLVRITSGRLAGVHGPLESEPNREALQLGPLFRSPANAILFRLALRAHDVVCRLTSPTQQAEQAVGQIYQPGI